MRQTPVSIGILFAMTAAGCVAPTQPIVARAQSDFAAANNPEPLAEKTPPKSATADRNGNDKKENGKNGDKEKEKEGPKHIRDNGFFIEEGYNQDSDEVQHIFNWINFWKRESNSRKRDFLGSYTMELPLGSQTHQFSFTTNFVHSFERPDTGPATLQGGTGDTFLNYRYQLLGDDEFLWCAPRFTLIAPTGDERFGTGTGQWGYQFNLPISRYDEDFDFHVNAGATLIPNVSTPLPSGVYSSPKDLRFYSVGGAVYWKPQTNLHFFTEFIAFWNESIDDDNIRRQKNQLLLNPGFRYAICQLEGVEWVIGVSVPIGLNRDSPDIGVFVYMSVEHVFFKKDENGGKD